MMLEMITCEFQVAPPSVEVNASMSDPNTPSIGTTTVPLGCTTGCPPMPCTESAVFKAGPQVRPPSIEVLIQTRPLALGSSHSTQQCPNKGLGAGSSQR